MSDLIKTPQMLDSKDCPDFSKKPICQKLPTRIAHIGEDLVIRRALPHRDRKMIGAWCFLDHFGPLDLEKNDGLNIAPHPHIGLQTLTWTLSGKIFHRDSLGSAQTIEPGQVNLMTAGNGIAHSEESLPTGILEGVQLWIALPDAVRQIPAEFSHYASVPNIKMDGLNVNVLVGEFLTTTSPAKIHSPLVGLELNGIKNITTQLPLNPKFEYGILPLVGDIEIGSETVESGTLAYLGCGRSSLSVRMKKNARALLIGGEPFEEEILIWWNFVARTKAEMLEATNAWNEHRHFGEVVGYEGGRLQAPLLSS